MQPDRNEFRKIIKKRLIELDMSQRGLAIQVGVNENYLTDILSGRRSGEKYRRRILLALGLEDEQSRNGREHK